MARNRKSPVRNRFSRALAVGGAIAGCLVLLLAVGRCSPLASSIPKGGSSEGARINPGPRPIHVFRYQTVLVDSESDAEAADADNQNTRSNTTVVKLNDAQFAEFKSTGKTDINVQLDQTPDTGKGVFRVALSREQIEAQNLLKFESDLRPTGAGVWTLSIPVSADTQVSQQVREYLVEVSISLKVDLNSN